MASQPRPAVMADSKPKASMSLAKVLRLLYERNITVRLLIEGPAKDYPSLSTQFLDAPHGTTGTYNPPPLTNGVDVRRGPLSLIDMVRISRQLSSCYPRPPEMRADRPGVFRYLREV